MPGGLVAHDDGRNAPAGGAVVAVNVAAADAAGGDADEDLVGAGAREGQVRDFEMVVLGKKQRLHGNLQPDRVRGWLERKWNLQIH